MNASTHIKEGSKFGKHELRAAIQSEYKEVACNPNHSIHFTSGRILAERLGYLKQIMEKMPESAVRPFAGVGNPHQMGLPETGNTIINIGCGAGLDCIYSSILTKGTTIIYGLDMTEEMLYQAQNNAAKANCSNISFLKGYAEELPIPSNAVDIVMSNGVINLCPHKNQVFQEIFRVLKPGGKLMISDVILDIPVPESSKELIHLWTNCVAGAITQLEYLDILKSAGFNQIVFGQTYDVFQDAKIAKSAAYFGAKGQNILGIKSK